MKIPIVLATVLFDIDAEGRLIVSIDGQRYAGGRNLCREDLRALVEEITTDLATAVRVEVHEADGAIYSDVATPPEPSTPTSAPAPALARALGEREPETAPPALAGAGFRPGEQVALAYVVARQEADPDGTAAINLPPALLARTRDGLVLLGLTSHTVAPIEAST